jgi:ribosomal protein L22
MAKQKQSEEVLESITAAPTEEQADSLLTKKQVKERVDGIKEMASELHPVAASERSHVEQDKLLKDVLEAIAAGAKEPDGLAKAALAVYNVEFTRFFG